MPKKKDKSKAKVYLDISIKLFLVLFGMADFAGILPPSLDIFDKVLTSVLLLYFWFKLKPAKFLFGRKSRILDTIILAGFYILAIDTFVPFISGITNETSIMISMISIYAGMAIIASVAVFITITVKPHMHSVLHSVVSIIDKKKMIWKEMQDNNRLLIPLKFILSLVVLLAMSQYLFGLINQWFIVSLDKSLLIVAILFAIKDLERSKVKVLQTVGSFDDRFLGKVTELFTKPEKFYIGIGFLLIFHYLSDLGAFFIPYLLNLGKDPYYFSLLGDQFLASGEVISTAHQTIWQLFMQENITNLSNLIITGGVYLLSAIGIISIMLIPIIICFFIVYDVDLREVTKKRFFYSGIGIAIVSIVVFLLASWVRQEAILLPNIFGVDFVTNLISSSAMLPIVVVFTLAISLFLITSFIIKRSSGIITAAGYLISLVFLGTYCWNYVVSSFNFYLNGQYGAITFFINNGNYITAAIIALLLLLDILFYMGGFLMLAYNSSRYFIKSMLKELLNNYLITGMAFSVLIVSIIVLSTINSDNMGVMMVSLFSFLIVALIFSIAMQRMLTGKNEFRDDFVLAIIGVIFMYLFLGLVVLILQVKFHLAEKVVNLLIPIATTVVAVYLAKYFKLKIRFKELKAKWLFAAVIVGVIFGLWFYFINEPITSILDSVIVFILVFTIFVAISEEILFRCIIYRLAAISFSKTKGLILQALVFTIIHFVFIRNIFEHYSSIWGVLIYFTSLFGYSILLGLLVQWRKADRETSINIAYPVLCHFLTNIILYSMMGL